MLVEPVSQLQLLKQLTDADAPPIAPSEPSSGAQEAATAGATSIASMFSAVICGAPIDVAAARYAGRRIADSIAEDSLANWLTTIRRHHEGTYQHCLLVTGVAVDFGD